MVVGGDHGDTTPITGYNLVMEILPQEFNGQFFFTNPDTEDFTAFWNGTPYTFEAMKTSPFYVLDANPLETQEIRKRFALKLAQRMWGKTKEYRDLEKKSEGKPTPMHYDPAKVLQPFIDQCLKPLPVAQTKVGRKHKEEPQLRIDPKTNKPAVRVYGEADQGGVSLVAEAEQAQ